MSISQILQPNSLKVYAGGINVANQLVTKVTKTLALGVSTPIISVTNLSAANPTASFRIEYCISMVNAAGTVAQSKVGIMDAAAVCTAAGVRTNSTGVATDGLYVSSNADANIATTVQTDLSVAGVVTYSLTVASTTLAAPSVANVGMQLQACYNTGANLVFV